MYSPLVLRAFRYRVCLGVQETRVINWEHSLRDLWNLALEQRFLGLRRTDKKYLSYEYQTSNENLTSLKRVDSGLVDAPSKASLAVLRRIDTAFQAWLNPTPAQKAQQKAAREARRRQGRSTRDMFRPRFKSWKRGDRVSIQVDQLARGEAPIRQDDQGRWQLHFPKLESIRVVYHRPLKGTPKTMTLSQEQDGHWYVSIVCELTDPEAQRKDAVVGIDRGVTDLIADSNGRTVPGLKFLSHALKKLRRQQRTVSRRQIKGSPDSARCRAEKAKVTQQHTKIRRQREAAHHEQTLFYAESAGVVVLENLNVKGMVKGRLARSIHEQGWSQFETQLAYKLQERGGELLKVPAAGSSQTCHACKNWDPEARKGKVYRCTSEVTCRLHGIRQDADLNSANVIRDRGIKILAERSAEGPAVQAETPTKKGRKGRRNSAKRESPGSSQVGTASPSAQGGAITGVSQ